MIEVHIGEAASYAAAGVDVRAGDEISQMWFDASEQTFGNRDGRFGELAVRASEFTGSRDIDLDVIQGIPGLVLSVGVDGVGTKTELAERNEARKYEKIEVKEKYRDHTGIPMDVGVMVLDDFARNGKVGIALATLFDVNSFNVNGDTEYSKEVVSQLCTGIITMANLAEVIVLNGESAELSDRVGGYGPFRYNLGGFGIGVARKDRIITGERVTPGDKIVAMREKGFRSNGMSLVRKVLEAHYGKDWHLDPEVCAEELVSQALLPSTMYSPAWIAMHGGFEGDPEIDVHGLVHVTGGGMPGKLQRLLAVTGYGAVIENQFAPSDVMLQIQDISLRHKKLATYDASALQSLNGGNGGLIVCPESEVSTAIRIGGLFGLELVEAGEIVEKPGIEILSKGVTNPGEWIRFIPLMAA
jgi:phosphoribosylformylglycinamidine cyclo-ligase